MRSLCLLAFGCLVGLVAYTYNLKIKTRALEVEAHALVNTLQDESDFLRLMRAEVSYLSRPDRIEDLARKTLNLEPITSAQLAPWAALSSDAASSPQLSSAPAAHKDGIAALIAKTSSQGGAEGVR